MLYRTPLNVWNWLPIMSDEHENLGTDFDALLSALEDVLSTDQLWELRIHADYDEHALALEMLCEMLGQVGAVVPEPADELFLGLANQLGVDEALLRGLRRRK